MKIFQSFLLLSAVALCSLCGFSQSRNVAEDTIFVDGVCDMCKKRIEEAAYGKGVRFVSWDKESKQLAIAYRADKTSLEEIEGRVAAIGHRTEHMEAKTEDYESLPKCCRYEQLETH